MKAWPLLISSRFDRDFRIVAVPDVLPAAQRYVLKSQCPTLKTSGIVKSQVEIFGIFAASIYLTILRAEPLLSDDRCAQLDPFGRPLYYVHGALLKTSVSIDDTLASEIIEHFKVINSQYLDQFLKFSDNEIEMYLPITTAMCNLSINQGEMQ